MYHPIKTITTHSMMIALGIGLAYLFAPIPNIELVTSTIFIAGFLFGIKSGLIVGVVTEGIYSLLSPYGMAPPPMFIAQIVSMGISGLCGGLMGGKMKNPELKRIWIFSIAGGLLTLNFALLTTLAYMWTIAGSIEALIAGLVQGLFFYVLHICSNIFLFTFLVPAAIKGIQKLTRNSDLCID